MALTPTLWFNIPIVEAHGRASTVNGTRYKTRMHGVDKMDTEGNSEEIKLENWKDKCFGWGQRG